MKNEITAYEPFKIELETLEKENKNLIFDYEDKKGNKDARSHVYKLRKSKAAVEKVRKEQKAESLAYGRKIDDEAGEIKTALESMIGVHERPLKEIEEKEQARIDDIKGKIEHIELLAVDLSELSSIDIGCRIDEVKGIALDEGFFAEFLADAGVAKDTSLESLSSAFNATKTREREQEELERLRKESAERELLERENAIRSESAERAKKEEEEKAEREKVARDQRERQEKEAAEKRELELKLQAEAAERRALEAERKAKEEAEAEKRKAKEEAEAREKNKAHKSEILKQALDALVSGGVPESAAREALKMIAARKVPNVTIIF